MLGTGDVMALTVVKLVMMPLVVYRLCVTSDLNPR